MIALDNVRTFIFHINIKIHLHRSVYHAKFSKRKDTKLANFSKNYMPRDKSLTRSIQIMVKVGKFLVGYFVGFQRILLKFHTFSNLAWYIERQGLFLFKKKETNNMTLSKKKNFTLFPSGHCHRHWVICFCRTVVDCTRLSTRYKLVEFFFL